MDIASTTESANWPASGSHAELARFAELQACLAPLFERLLPDPGAPRTVLVNPSLSLDADVIENIAGLPHYEERMLCMLMLLRLPRTRVVYVSSVPIEPAIVDYYLHLLPGVPGIHARQRLTMLSCHDPSTRETLTQKLLARPRLLARLRTAIGDPSVAHMTCFHATAPERSLAVRLGIPIYGNDPALEHLGSKSGSRRVFAEAGVTMPAGVEGLRDMRDVTGALARLKRDDPALKRATVKLEYGTSGEGNALVDLGAAPAGTGLETWLARELPTRLRFEEARMDWAHYAAKFEETGGVVEAWVEGDTKSSPSVQGRITPVGGVELISTHDQVMGGPSGQIFLGSTFPAHEDYRVEIQHAGLRVADALRGHGALGRFGVDFVSVCDAGNWTHYAIEVNLRKGGTTHTYRMLQFLTDGLYDEATGVFTTRSGEPRYYQATDNLKNPAYRRLTSEDLVDIAVENGLHFSGATQTGVVFHLIGALSGYGKLGMVCVGASRADAATLYANTVAILNAEALAGA